MSKRLIGLILVIKACTISLAAHLPGSNCSWMYGQYYLDHHVCYSNETDRTPYQCLDYIYRPTKQTILSAAYNGLLEKSKKRQHYYQQQQSPSLEIGVETDPSDWTELNNLLKNITLTLPDFTTSIKEGIITATIHLTKLKCGGLSIIDLELIPTRPDDQHLDMVISVTGLTLKCAADWTITTNLAVHGSGALTADSKGSNLSSKVILTSTNLNNVPPSSSIDSSCTSNVLISDLSFTGGTLATILGWFKSTIIKELTTTINPLLCSELKILVDDTLTSALINASHLIDPYLTKEALIPPNIVNREKNLIAPIINSGDYLVSLSKNTWMKDIFNFTEIFLGWNETEKNWGINTLINDVIPKGEINISNISKILYSSTSPSVFSPSIIINDNDGMKSPIDITIILDSLKLKGLSSFTNVNLLYPLSFLNYTLLNQFSMKGLSLDVGIHLEMTPTNDGIVGDDGTRNDQTIDEYISFQIALDKLNFNTTVVLAIDGKTLSNTRLSNIVNDPQGCLFNNIKVMNFTSLSLNIGSITPILINGFVSKGLDRLADDLAQSFSLSYYDSLLIALPSIAEHVVRPIINKGLNNYLKNHSICHEVPIPPVGNIVNLLKSPAFAKLRSLLHKYVTVNWLNSMIDKYTHSQSGEWGGVIKIVGSLIGKGGVSVNIPQIGHLSLDVGNLTLSGLDTIGNYELLNPTSAHEVSNELLLGSPPLSPFIPSIDVKLNLIGSQVNITDHVSLGLNFSTFNVIVDTLLLLNGHWVEKMTLEDATRNGLGCWAAMINDTRLVDNHTSITVQELKFKLNCEQCTSPDMPDFIKRTHDNDAQVQITNELNNFVQRMIAHLYSDFAHNETMNIIKSMAETCPQSGTFPIMPPSPSPSNSPIQPIKEEGCYDAKAGVISTASSFVLLLILFFIYRTYCHKKLKKKIKKIMEKKSNNGGSSQQLEDPLLSDNLTYSSNSVGRRPRFTTQDYVLRKRDVSLLFHPSISPWIRYGVFISILINLGFFISGHTSVGASVDLVAHFAGDELTYNTIYTFSLSSSLGDMWTACAIVLATLIGSFSGAWPYIKLLLMLIVWCLKPSWLSSRKRGGLMQLLDIMGKWSLIDLYVLVMSMIAFYVQLHSPDLKILPTNFYLFSLWVTPLWGLYAFCFAVTSSLLLSHVQIVAHRDAVASDRQEVALIRSNINSFDDDNNDENTSILNDSILNNSMNSIDNDDDTLYSSERSHLNATRIKKKKTPKFRRRRSSWFDAGTLDLPKIRKGLIVAKESVWNHVYHVEMDHSHSATLNFGFKKRGKCMVSCLPILSFCLLMLGAVVPSFQFKIHGVAGILQDFGRTNSSVVNYSLFTVCSRLLEQSSNSLTTKSYIGIKFVATLYIIFSYIIPACQKIILLIMWSVPMKLRFQKKFFFLTEVLSSWSATEVYIIATVVAALEIGDISKKIIGNSCDPLNPIFHVLHELDMLAADDELCFEVGAEIRWGAYILLSASIIGMISTELIVRLTETSIEDRENRVKGEDHDNQNMTGCGHTVLKFLINRCIGCCILRMNGGIDEDNMTEETYTHLRSRRSSLGSRRSWGGKGIGRGRTGTNSSVASSSAVGRLSSISVRDDNSIAADDGLPPGWTIMMDEKSKSAYYWNELSGKMTRIKPVWTRRFETGELVGSSSKVTQLPSTPTDTGLFGIAEEEDEVVDGRDRIQFKVNKVPDE